MLLEFIFVSIQLPMINDLGFDGFVVFVIDAGDGCFVVRVVRRMVF